MRLSIRTKLFPILLLALTAQAAEEFSIYQPKYRSTEELVSLAESTFGNKATFSAINGKVVINASPKTTQSVLKLFNEIDTRRRQFKTSFRLVSRAEAARNSIGFKDGEVTVKEKPSASGTISVESARGEEQAETLQSAQFLEGSEVSVALGTYWAPGGFVAKARGGAGNSVVLEFRQREPDANPALSLSSEVQVRLDEWKTVGEVSQTTEKSREGIMSRGSGQNAGTKELQVKVELAN